MDLLSTRGHLSKNGGDRGYKVRITDSGVHKNIHKGAGN